MERPRLVEGGRLEASLLQMVDDHNRASVELREHTERAKRDAIRKAARVSDLLVNSVNGGVQEIFVNEKRIEMEIRALAATIARFSKQTERWLAASHAINNAVKVDQEMPQVRTTD
ncbi:biogenesis of lysosome-related organelles complex1 subunit 1 [Striga asiatica]|uniref:Biogenesis of lysosome-related organelles complex 1 subunit 1 n=1 Tax=Striga asiatica TaxID=4170 RepID=A0A5A7RDY5_STRAF|nr:biogenesis of lysosome-related organelles complex1 subunit 1 [Striga asiatica]